MVGVTNMASYIRGVTGASTDLEAEASNNGKLSLSDEPESDAEAVPEWNPRPKPSAE